MPRATRLLFLLTDGGRARLVERSPGNGHYVTIEEIDGGSRLQTLREELATSAPGRSISSTSPRRASVGRDDYLRPAKEAFVSEVADRAATVCRRAKFDGVVVAAPSRLIGPLKRSLEGRIAVAGALRKDLTKAPDSALGAWLNDAFANAQLSR